jgi:hypothetical protein
MYVFRVHLALYQMADAWIQSTAMADRSLCLWSKHRLVDCYWYISTHTENSQAHKYYTDVALHQEYPVLYRTRGNVYKNNQI